LQLGPVKYLGRGGDDELLFDYNQVFENDLPIGTTVHLLDGRGAFVPAHAETLGSLYLTDSNAGRAAASASLDGLVAAGIDLVKTVVYPGDRGLGAEGSPISGAQKLSDRVGIWSESEEEIDAARNS
jgi:hypothetical protein